jgi:hypothetical protein
LLGGASTFGRRSGEFDADERSTLAEIEGSG